MFTDMNLGFKVRFLLSGDIIYVYPNHVGKVTAASHGWQIPPEASTADYITPNGITTLLI